MYLHELELENGEEILCDGEFLVTGMNYSKEEKTLTFAENRHFAEQALNNQNVSCVIVEKGLYHMIPKTCGIIISEDPRKTFYQIHNKYDQYAIYEKKVPTLIGEGSCIAKTALISNYNVKIGKNVYIDDFVQIHESVTIGDNTIVHAGCTIGGYGFQFPRAAEGTIIRSKHYGKVEIGDNVEVFEHTNIARGVFYNEITKIGNNTKIDVMCHIAHSVQIGSNTMIVAKAMIAGSARIGNNVWIGPMASISNLITVGDNARVLIGSVVTKDVGKGEVVSGNFAIPHAKQLQNVKNLIKEERS